MRDFATLKFKHMSTWIKKTINYSRADLGGGGGGGVLGELKHPPPNFYNEQARKLLEAVVQVQLHFIHTYGQ